MNKEVWLKAMSVKHNKEMAEPLRHVIVKLGYAGTYATRTLENVSLLSNVLQVQLTNHSTGRIKGLIGYLRWGAKMGQFLSAHHQTWPVGHFWALKQTLLSFIM